MSILYTFIAFVRAAISEQYSAPNVHFYNVSQVGKYSPSNLPVVLFLIFVFFYCLRAMQFMK
jgi:hypothetical protein